MTSPRCGSETEEDGNILFAPMEAATAALGPAYLPPTSVGQVPLTTCVGGTATAAPSGSHLTYLPSCRMGQVEWESTLSGCQSSQICISC